MNKTITFYKKIGETPLQCIDRLRREQPELADEKISYAGRLDPMAEGEMLFMIGGANHEREKNLGLDKEYEFQILFGVSTDTGDVLGLVKNFSEQEISLTSQDVEGELKKLVGKIEQVYPWYSSKTINGKPLFEYAREGKQDEIERPTREVEIYSLELLETRNIDKEDLQKYIENKIYLVRGDFRQDEILQTWKKYFEADALPEYQIAKIKIKCSSGTYVRALTEMVGDKLGISTLALSINRVRVVSLNKGEEK